MLTANSDGQREAGVITSACRDNDRGGTVWCNVDLHNGGSQAFGGYALHTGKILKAWEDALCVTFGVERLPELKGKKCFVLRHFGSNNDTIVGLESVNTGLRFTIYAFRKDMKLAGGNRTGLQVTVERLERELAYAEQQFLTAKADLSNVHKLFKEW